MSLWVFAGDLADRRGTKGVAPKETANLLGKHTLAFP
jgi:hypothetical protein